MEQLDIFVLSPQTEEEADELPRYVDGSPLKPACVYCADAEQAEAVSIAAVNIGLKPKVRLG